MVVTKKKSSRVSKKKNSWLPAKGRSRTTVIVLFALIIGIVGYVAITQSFAYSVMFKYYSQWDAAWANSAYPYVPGTRNQSDIKMSRSGCGPTAMAMVASSLKRTVSPIDLAKWYGGRYHTSYGTDPAVYPVFASDFGLTYASLGGFDNRNTRVAIQQKLKAGRNLVIIHAGPGYFTGSGHILVMREYNASKDQYLIADPNNSRNNRWFAGSNLLRDANLRNAYSFTR